ncbi:hypothetical protein KAX17_18110 [Candidatus Bipolaricaulota bacterium]|nr:hypothetical protein [Candidatus Bipolaricaulota bacterium]
MKSWWVRGSVVLVVLVLFVTIASAAASPCSTRCASYRLGEPIVFMVKDQKTSGWCCCCCTCPDTQILGWYIVDSDGDTVNSLEFDPVGYASDWDGTWSQTDDLGASVPAGTYTLYVETSVGLLSRCLKLYDPCSCCSGCNCCWSYSRCWGWRCCTCGQVATITHGCCRTSLVLTQEKTTRCSFRLRWPCCP